MKILLQYSFFCLAFLSICFLSVAHGQYFYAVDSSPSFPLSSPKDIRAFREGYIVTEYGNSRIVVAAGGDDDSSGPLEYGTGSTCGGTSLSNLSLKNPYGVHVLDPYAQKQSVLLSTTPFDSVCKYNSSKGVVTCPFIGTCQPTNGTSILQGPTAITSFPAIDGSSYVLVAQKSSIVQWNSANPNQTATFPTPPNETPLFLTADQTFVYFTTSAYLQKLSLSTNSSAAMHQGNFTGVTWDPLHNVLYVSECFPFSCFINKVLPNGTMIRGVIGNSSFPNLEGPGNSVKFQDLQGISINPRTGSIWAVEQTSWGSPNSGRIRKIVQAHWNSLDTSKFSQTRSIKASGVFFYSRNYICFLVSRTIGYSQVLQGSGYMSLTQSTTENNISYASRGTCTGPWSSLSIPPSPAPAMLCSPELIAIDGVSYVLVIRDVDANMAVYVDTAQCYPTPLPSPTPSPTPTASLTPSLSPSPSPSNFPDSPTPTPTPTPSLTPTPSQEFSNFPTVSCTPTETPSLVPPTETPSVVPITPSPSPTPLVVITPLPPPTVAPTPQSTPVSSIFAATTPQEVQAEQATVATVAISSVSTSATSSAMNLLSAKGATLTGSLAVVMHAVDVVQYTSLMTQMNVEMPESLKRGGQMFSSLNFFVPYEGLVGNGNLNDTSISRNSTSSSHFYSKFSASDALDSILGKGTPMRPEVMLLFNSASLMTMLLASVVGCSVLFIVLFLLGKAKKSKLAQLIVDSIMRILVLGYSGISFTVFLYFSTCGLTSNVFPLAVALLVTYPFGFIILSAFVIHKSKYSLVPTTYNVATEALCSPDYSKDKHYFFVILSVQRVLIAATVSCLTSAEGQIVSLLFLNIAFVFFVVWLKPHSHFIFYFCEVAACVTKILSTFCTISFLPHFSLSSEAKEIIGIFILVLQALGIMFIFFPIVAFFLKDMWNKLEESKYKHAKKLEGPTRMKTNKGWLGNLMEKLSFSDTSGGQSVLDPEHPQNSFSFSSLRKGEFELSPILERPSSPVAAHTSFSSFTVGTSPSPLALPKHLLISVPLSPPPMLNLLTPKAEVPLKNGPISPLALDGERRSRQQMAAALTLKAPLTLPMRPPPTNLL